MNVYNLFKIAAAFAVTAVFVSLCLLAIVAIAKGIFDILNPEDESE